MTGADRARVPFAVIGVLLLVTSATVVTTNTTSPGPPELATATATDRAVLESRTAVRAAVTTAARKAALAPVVDPANTTAGAALNETAPFRDALRLRIVAAVRDRLDRVERRRGDVEVRAGLPLGEDPTLRERKRRVSLASADENATTMRVRVEDVTIRARVDGRSRVVRRFSPTVVVATPVLGLHDRVSTYQGRLEAGLTRPGLARVLTVQLYALAWARGYAQYAGAPVENVLGNRHVALATNAGLLWVQHDSFGVTDPDGRRGVAVAAGALAGSAVTGVADPGVDKVLGSGEPPPLVRPETATPGPGDALTVGVNQSADAALAATLDGDRGDGAVTDPAIRRDLAALNRRVRAIRVSVERGRIGTFEAAPAERLASRVRDRRSSFLDARGPDGAAPAVELRAVRESYLEAVLERLDARAADRADRAGDFDRILDLSGGASLGRLRAATDASVGPTAPPAPSVSGPAGPVALRVDSAPAYLSLERVASERVPALEGSGHPLVARNTNLFTLPVDDVRDALRDRGSRVATPGCAYAGYPRGLVGGGPTVPDTERSGAGADPEPTELVPVGLPLTPTMNPWVATLNVWHVTVRGEYARFGLRTDRRSATGHGSSLAYVRDGDVASTDVDGDGDPERLGRASRVTFDVSTTVVVVVPPGPPGVGDRDGDADERSAGWPEPLSGETHNTQTRPCPGSGR